MATFNYEAMDSTGAEVKDTIEAGTAEEAQAKIRQMGYFVTKLAEKSKGKKKKPGAKKGKKKKSFSIGGCRLRN